MPEEGEGLADVDCGQARDADAGGGHEEGVQKADGLPGPGADWEHQKQRPQQRPHEEAQHDDSGCGGFSFFHSISDAKASLSAFLIFMPPSYFGRN